MTILSTGSGLSTFRNDMVPFLRLPAELRNRIYDLCLGYQSLHIRYQPYSHENRQYQGERYHIVRKGGLYCRAAPYWEEGCPLEGGTRPHDMERGQGTTEAEEVATRLWRFALLRVCRQTYRETALLPYTLNSFSFDNAWVLRKFLKNIKPVHKRVIGKLESFWCGDEGKRSGELFYDTTRVGDAQWLEKMKRRKRTMEEKSLTPSRVRWDPLPPLETRHRFKTLTYQAGKSNVVAENLQPHSKEWKQRIDGVQAARVEGCSTLNNVALYPASGTTRQQSSSFRPGW